MLPWVLRYGRRTPFVWNSLLLPQKTMKKSEPMLVGDIIRQMLSDPRIKALTDDHAMPAHGSPAHGSPAHGMHGTDENNINLNNNISVADQSVKARCRFQKPSVEEVDAFMTKCDRMCQEDENAICRCRIFAL